MKVSGNLFEKERASQIEKLEKKIIECKTWTKCDSHPRGLPLIFETLTRPFSEFFSPTAHTRSDPSLGGASKIKLWDLAEIYIYMVLRTGFDSIFLDLGTSFRNPRSESEDLSLGNLGQN
ncbi:hypothetical protein PanWU01x14_090030 [Parasponia andersonii]|uniref:Uncharacterized protein n=1 Tax=Parasponia andersonii TaxID=3476 RepID=A0A2P5D7K4_PARAD|nr:hypothetical protein PanWU01x14_090030 [Parasponia andersonii]